MKNSFNVTSMAIAIVFIIYRAPAQDYPTAPPMVPAMTEIWTPQPPIVTPGYPDVLVSPPSDAKILLSEKEISQWVHQDGRPLEWDIEDGIMTVKGGTGSVVTKSVFNDFQLHLEWSAPTEICGKSQGRGNSGVLLQGLYEVQILDNYQNETYVNGQAGSIYKQSPPLVNPIRKPGEWNTFDIIYTAPRFKDNGSLHSHGRVTILFNGVLVQNNTLIQGTTQYIGLPRMVPHGAGPILLQDHNDAVRFRNIWIREL